MAPTRTRTVKNKHAASKAGTNAIKAAQRAPPDGVLKARKQKREAPRFTSTKSAIEALKKKKKKVYKEEELDLPKLNMITPAGVIKPKGKKKGKVFVDDRESMNTILAIVQAEKEGQIESKMIKARQMEEIREARRVEAEQREQEKKEKLEDVKDSLRKKRKKPRAGKDEDVKALTSTGTRAAKPKKKQVRFTETES